MTSALTPAAVAFLRALKGAPLSVLVALRVLGRAGTGDLEVATGYNTGAVVAALRVLAGLGYVDHVSRYAGWQLTTTAGQLPLFIPSQLDGIDSGAALGEVRKSDLEVRKADFPLVGSGGGLTDLSLLTTNVLTTTTTASEVRKSDLEVRKSDFPDNEAARLAEILVTRTFCNRKRALTAIATARAAGAVDPEIEIDILRWAGWYEDPQVSKKGLNNPAYFIAKKIADREAAPPGHIKSWSADMYRIERLQRQLAGTDDDADYADYADDEDDEDDADATEDAEPTEEHTNG